MGHTKLYVSTVWITVCIGIMYLAGSLIMIDRGDIRGICQQIDEYERNLSLFGRGSVHTLHSSSSSSPNVTTSVPMYVLHTHVGCIIPGNPAPGMNVSETVSHTKYRERCSALVNALLNMHNETMNEKNINNDNDADSSYSYRTPILRYEFHSLGIISAKDLPLHYPTDDNSFRISYETVLYRSTELSLRTLYTSYINQRTILNSMIRHIPFFIVLDTVKDDTHDNSSDNDKQHTIHVSSLGFLYTNTLPLSTGHPLASLLSLLYTTVYSITLDEEYSGEWYNILPFTTVADSASSSNASSSSSIRYVDKYGKPLPLSITTQKYLQSYLHLQWLRQQSIDAHTWSISSLTTVFDIFLLHGSSTEMEMFIRSLPSSTMRLFEEYVHRLHNHLLNSSSSVPTDTYLNLRYRSGIQGKVFNEELLQIYPYGDTLDWDETDPTENGSDTEIDDNYIFTINDYVFMTSPTLLAESIQPLNTIDSIDSLYSRIPPDNVWNYSSPNQPIELSSVNVSLLFPDLLHQSNLPSLTECHLFQEDARYHDYADLSVPFHTRHSFGGTKNDLQRTPYNYLVELVKEWKYEFTTAKSFGTYSPFNSLPCRPEHQYICTVTDNAYSTNGIPTYASFYCKVSTVPSLSRHVIYIPPAPLYPLYIKTSVPSPDVSGKVINQSSTLLHDLPSRWTYNHTSIPYSVQLSSDIQVRKYGIIHIANCFHQYRAKHPEWFADKRTSTEMHLPDLTLSLVSGIRKVLGLPSKTLTSVTFVPEKVAVDPMPIESETVEVDSQGEIHSPPQYSPESSPASSLVSGKYLFETVMPIPQSSVTPLSFSSFETLNYLYRWNHVQRDKVIEALQATCRLANAEYRIRVPNHIVSILRQSMEQLVSLTFFIRNVSITIHSMDEHIHALQSIAYRLQSIRWFTDSLTTDPYLSVDMYMQLVHRMAVYLPIWAPMILPLCIAFLHSLRRLFKGKTKPSNDTHTQATEFSSLTEPSSSNALPSKPTALPIMSLFDSSFLTLDEHNQLLAYLQAKLGEQASLSESVYYREKDYGIASICQGKGTLFIRPYDHQNMNGNDEFDGPSVRSLYAAGQATHTVNPTAAAIHLPWLRTVVYGDMKHVPEKYQESVTNRPRSKQFWVATMDATEFRTCFGIPEETMRQSFETYENTCKFIQNRSLTTNVIVPHSDTNTFERSVNYGESYIDSDEYFDRVRTLMKECSLPTGFRQPSNEDVQTLAGVRTGCIHFDRFKRVIVGTVAMVPFVPDETGDEEIIGEALAKLRKKNDAHSSTVVPISNIGELKRMSITPFARRSGIAKVLVNHAENWTRIFTRYRNVYLSTLRTMVGAPPLYVSCKYTDITRTAWLKGSMFGTGSGISGSKSTIVGSKDDDEKKQDILPAEVLMFVAEFGKILYDE